MRNSINVHDHQTLEELWQLFSSAIKPTNDSKDTTVVSDESKHEKDKHIQKSDTDAKESSIACELNEEDASEVTVMSDGLKPKKKKHKREREIEIDSTTTEQNGVDTSQAAECISSPEKKRKKKKHKSSTGSSTNSSAEKVREDGDGEFCPNPTKDCGPLVTCELGKEPIPVAKRKKRNKSKMQVAADEKTLKDEREDSNKEVGSSPVEVALEYINGLQPLQPQEGDEKDIENDGKAKKKKKHQRTEGMSDCDAVSVRSKKMKIESKDKLKRHKKHKH